MEPSLLTVRGGDSNIPDPPWRGLMRTYFAALILGLFAMRPAAADDQCKVIFDGKVFVDYGNMVNVEGIVAKKDSNTQKVDNIYTLTCYRGRNECIGLELWITNTMIHATMIPEFFEIILWTTDQIVANKDVGCGSDTWTLDRRTKTAELISHPCSSGANTGHYTLK
jgi:hypothetical protein